MYRGTLSSNDHGQNQHADDESQPSQQHQHQHQQQQLPTLPEAEDEQGFDLTKGFQTIGSYHAPVGSGKQVQPATNGDAVTVNPNGRLSEQQSSIVG